VTPLRPLNDRVLIKPHKNPDVTETGLILPEQRSEQYMEMQGTVIAVGRQTHPKQQAAFDLADDIKRHGYSDGAANLIRSLVRKTPVVKAGDDVLFSWTAGQEITVEDDRYLLLREDDLLAVLETA
jgi:chaperonin GroES